MIDLFKKAFGYILLHMLKYVSGMQEMCDEEVCSDPRFLPFVPDCFKTPGICNEAVHRKPYTPWYVPDHLRTQKMFEGVVENEPWLLKYVPDWLKT